MVIVNLKLIRYTHSQLHRTNQFYTKKKSWGYNRDRIYIWVWAPSLCFTSVVTVWKMIIRGQMLSYCSINSATIWCNLTIYNHNSPATVRWVKWWFFKYRITKKDLIIVNLPTKWNGMTPVWQLKLNWERKLKAQEYDSPYPSMVFYLSLAALYTASLS